MVGTFVTYAQPPVTLLGAMSTSVGFGWKDDIGSKPKHRINPSGQ